MIMNFKGIYSWTFYHQIFYQILFLVTVCICNGEQSHEQTGHTAELLASLPPAPSVAPSSLLLSPTIENLNYAPAQVQKLTFSQDSAGTGLDINLSSATATPVTAIKSSEPDTNTQTVFVAPTPAPAPTSSSQLLDNYTNKDKYKKAHLLRAAAKISKRKLMKISSSANNTTDQKGSPVTFQKQNPFKGITDLIQYGLRTDIIESRTGIMLFAGITALEILTATTLFFGTTGALLGGLVLMIYML